MELDAQRWRTDSGFPLPLRHQDVQAWAQSMKRALHPLEVVAVLSLDSERRAFDDERRRRQAAEEEDDEDER